MTVSMLTTRLSSVITGCGSKDTTCSRRSTISRMRSMKGTPTGRPGLSSRLSRPSRSTTPARACGTTRIVRASTSRTKTATTSKTINATTTDLLLIDERSRALDLRNFDLRAGLEHLAVHVRTRGPFLAADADATAAPVHALQDGRLRADERRRPGAHERRNMQMRTRDRPQEHQRAKRSEDEHEQLARSTGTDGG